VTESFKEAVEDLLPDVLIHSVTFDHQDGVVEITFAEYRDQGDGVGLLKTIDIELALFANEVRELESDIKDLIDEALLALRNPDAVKERIERARPDLEEDDD
jgi:hypothetical protein